jgi:predicted naringenin-chalcone synthase
MQIGITAIGTAVPQFKQSQSNAAEIVADILDLEGTERRLLKRLYKATQIEYRYSVIGDYLKQRGEFEFFPNDYDASFPSTAARMSLYKANALNLGLSAIENCLASIKNVDPRDITHLITVSCTGMYAPGLDIEIIQQLHLSSTTKRFAVNFMGCYAAFNAMELAYNICKADSQAKVLVVCVELCTLHFQQSRSMDNVIANAIFADGAAAVLIESSDGSRNSLNFLKFHCDLLPQTEQEMAWHISDFGFDIVLSSYVPNLIESGIAKFVEKLLGEQSLKLVDIDFYAIHPGGVKILKACEQALNIKEHDNRYAYEVLRQFGNMSSVTILFVLKALWQNLDSQDHGKNIMSFAFGPGLSIQSMLIRPHYV